MCEIATPKIRLQLWNELLSLRPPKTPKSVTRTKIEAVKERLLQDRDLWHYVYCKYGNHALFDDPVSFIRTSSTEQQKAVQTFWGWWETATREITKERSPRHTWINLQNNLARNWNVDISDADAQTLWAEFKPYLKKERQKYYNNGRGILRDADKFGVSPTEIGSAEEIEEPFSVDDCLTGFITIRIGNRAFYDDETFVQSDYVKNFGKVFELENILKQKL